MSRQNIYARNNFFNASMQRAKMVKKKKKDIQSIRYGNVVVPDPVSTVETEDVIEKDLEVVDDE